MNISKQSWHYRFNDAWGDRKVASGQLFTTCSYIRHTLWSMFKCLFAVTAIVCMVAVALCMVGAALAFPFALLFGYTLAAVKMMPLALYTYGMGIVTGSVWVYHKWIKPRREESLLAKAMDDRKNGICTLVKFQ